MKRILLCDDDVDLLDLCAAIFKFKGWDVCCKNNCRQILSDIEEYKPDVILMDNRIPDTGGIKAIQLIKNTVQFKNIPVIFFSANSGIRELAKEAGTDYILQKPFDLRDLEKVIIAATQTKI
jgi:DNA-binding response OmpR family regulator